MAYVANEVVRIIAGKYKKQKKAIFMNYTGKLSCVIKQMDCDDPCLWTVRLTSIRKIIVQGNTITIDRDQYISLVEDVKKMSQLLSDIHKKIELMKIDNK